MPTITDRTPVNEHQLHRQLHHKLSAKMSPSVSQDKSTSSFLSSIHPHSTSASPQTQAQEALSIPVTVAQTVWIF